MKYCRRCAVLLSICGGPQLNSDSSDLRLSALTLGVAAAKNFHFFGQLCQFLVRVFFLLQSLAEQSNSLVIAEFLRNSSYSSIGSDLIVFYALSGSN
jgi:hypothetical protein